MRDHLLKHRFESWVKERKGDFQEMLDKLEIDEYTYEVAWMAWVSALQAKCLYDGNGTESDE